MCICVLETLQASYENFDRNKKKHGDLTIKIRDMQIKKEQKEADKDWYLTTGMMRAISPIQVFSSTVIICMNQLMDKHLSYLILNSNVITTYHYLQYAKMEKRSNQHEYIEILCV